VLKILVVEDDNGVYAYIARIFAAMMPTEEAELTRAESVAAALEKIQEPWDVILMDYSLGDSAALEGTPIHDGGDLIRVRRAVEERSPESRRAREDLRGVHFTHIVGTSSSHVGNELLLELGANASFLKHQIPELIADIQRRF
jgi:CheY-like chemotaxis protein